MGVAISKQQRIQHHKEKLTPLSPPVRDEQQVPRQQQQQQPASSLPESLVTKIENMEALLDEKFDNKAGRVNRSYSMPSRPTNRLFRPPSPPSDPNSTSPRLRRHQTESSVTMQLNSFLAIVQKFKLEERSIFVFDDFFSIEYMNEKCVYKMNCKQYIDYSEEIPCVENGFTKTRVSLLHLFSSESATKIKEEVNLFLQNPSSYLHKKEELQNQKEPGNGSLFNACLVLKRYKGDTSPTAGNVTRIVRAASSKVMKPKGEEETIPLLSTSASSSSLSPNSIALPRSPHFFQGSSPRANSFYSSTSPRSDIPISVDVYYISRKGEPFFLACIA